MGFFIIIEYVFKTSNQVIDITPKLMKNNQFINKSQLQFLTKLLKMHSPSGCEGNLVRFLDEYMSKYCKTTTDTIGNLYMEVGRNDGLRIMITAHCDEVGLQVVYIDKNGYVYARNVASIDKQTVPGNVVTALTQHGEIEGVIGKKSPHVIDSKEKDQIPNICDLWIDFGFESKEEAIQNIQCGDYLVLSSTPRITNNGKRIISKALDDKIGVFILAEVIKNLSKIDLPFSVVGVATTQEEIGCRGAFVAANRIKPDIAFCLDVGIVTDIPTMSNQHYGEFSLGKGVGLIQNANNNEILVNSLIKVATEKNIPFQKTIGHRPTGGTETSLIQLSNMGVATANISIPNRYMHSLVEMCDLRDVKNAIDLLSAEIYHLYDYSKEDFRLFK